MAAMLMESSLIEALFIKALLTEAMLMDRNLPCQIGAVAGLGNRGVTGANVLFPSPICRHGGTCSFPLSRLQEQKLSLISPLPLAGEGGARGATAKRAPGEGGAGAMSTHAPGEGVCSRPRIP
mgnify:CR=1 FL=1